MINRSAWPAQRFELISQMNGMSQALRENQRSSQRPSGCAVSEQADKEREM